MATIQEVAPAPWRIRFSGMPASYGGVRYHVEQQQRSSGRRVVLHEYPKRDTPYSEDMGRAAIRYQVTGYLVGPAYDVDKKRLIAVLENSAGATLIDPYLAEPKVCICDRYSVSERRERGGYCVFEMSFLEVGQSGNTPSTETGTGANNQAGSTSSAAASNLDNLTMDEAQRATV